MSQTEDDLEKYRGTAGAEVKTTNISSDDNPLKQRLGDSDGAKERQYDPKIAGERFVQFYDDSAAAIREYLSNAETACIRRARHELLDAGFSEDEVPVETTDLLEMAKEEVGYEPLIEVTYNRKPDEVRLIIEDNGIGISTEEYEVVQRIGYSTSHDTGSQLGNFGMGWMSGFQLTSINGMFKMFTKSYLTDEAYGTIEYVANCEFLDVYPDEYGTRFEFPGFGEAAKSIDIRSKVEEFTAGMPVPVLYREFDESGNETPHSDDYLATRLEDAYADDSMVVTYENEFFKAVMSPDRKEDSRGLTTYNISMPIRRNTDGFGSNKQFEAPWKWDFRGKKENGPIVACESDPSLVGQVPKEDTKYDRLMEELQEDCVPMSQVPDDAIVMPEPASSRDSFKSGHNDFWKHVSEKLNEAWADVAKERFEDLDSWDDFLDMERDEKHALFRAYSHFGPKYSDVDPDTVQEALEDKLGVTIDKDLGMRLHESKSKVQVVSRGSSRAHTKGAAHGKKIWQVTDEAPDGVYMGVSVSQKKADIAWGLGDTHVVRLDDTSEYKELEDSWDWNKLKDLPNYNLEEKLPELDQDVIDEYDNVSASDSNNTRSSSKSTGGDGKNPEKYRMKVRVGSNSRKYFTTNRVEDVVDLLEDDKDVRAGRYKIKYLVIYKDDVSARTVGNNANHRNDIGATRVPEYVYEHLEGKKNVYTSTQDVRDEHAGTDVELSDGTVMDIRDVPESDCLLITGSKTRDRFEDNPEDLLKVMNKDPDEFDRFTFLNGSELRDAWNVTTEATIYKTYGGSKTGTFDDYTYTRDRYDDLVMADRLAGMDESSAEYKALFGSRYGEPSGDTLDTLIEIAKKAGLTDD